VKRRHFIAALAAWSVTARAQPRRRVVGMLDTSPRAVNPNFDALVERLHNHGHGEGENLAFAYRSADGRNDRFPALARELVDLGVDVIVTRGTPAALAAKAVTATMPIPVVMAAAGDPETIARTRRSRRSISRGSAPTPAGSRQSASRCCATSFPRPNGSPG
jgi:ABC-type uncharacterized transport system substrate-binding protein